MKLLHYAKSSCSWRVRTAIFHKALDVEMISVNLLAGGQHALPDPMRQVPVLVHGSMRLTQSMAILHHLESRFTRRPLVPSDPMARTQMLALCEIVNSGIQPLQNLATLAHVRAIGGDDRAWGRHVITHGLQALQDTALSFGCSTPFLVGHHPTWADACLVPQLYNARRFECDLGGLDHLVAVEARCLRIEGFERAHPRHFTEAPNVPGHHRLALAPLVRPRSGPHPSVSG